jgi:CheY-like chemotaxis protein
MAKELDGLVRKLKDRGPSTRWSAAKSLGMLGDARAVRPLTTNLKDEDEYAQAAVVEALVKLNATYAMERLDALLNANEARKSIAAARRFVRIKAALRDYDIPRSVVEVLRKDVNGLILWAEDDDDIAEMVEVLLEDYFRIIRVLDGSDVINLARTNIFDIILLDIMMPFTNGREVVIQLKEEKSIQHIPVVICSVIWWNGNYWPGVEAAVFKPFDPYTFRDMLKQIMHNVKLGIYGED